MEKKEKKEGIIKKNIRKFMDYYEEKNKIQKEISDEYLGSQKKAYKMLKEEGKEIIKEKTMVILAILVVIVVFGLNFLISHVL